MTIITNARGFDEKKKKHINDCKENKQKAIEEIACLRFVKVGSSVMR